MLLSFRSYSDLNWIPANELPIDGISQDLRRRAVGALKSVVLEAVQDDDGGEHAEKPSCLEKACACFCTSCTCEVDLPGPFKMKEVGVDLRRAESLGLKLGKNLLVPSLPKALRDLWVVFELTANIAQFVVACVFISFNSNLAYNVAFLVLSGISTFLALVDGFVYFYTLGSCHQCLEMCQNRGNKSESKYGSSGSSDEVSANKRKTKWEKFKKSLSDSLEIVRTLLSELLIYPLLMFDLFEIAGSRVITFDSAEERISLTLFVIGTFLLVVTVYFVRSAILLTTMLQLNKLPVTCLHQHDHLLVITRFIIHVILQMCTQAVCIIAVGVKIRQENRENTTDFYLVSPFLWYVVAAGWVIPLLGVIMYFFVKYYWFKDFSAGLFLDMMALLQTQGFAEAVFHGKAKETAEDSAKKFLQRVDYVSTKVMFDDRQKQVSFLYKFMYPLKIPVFLVFGTLYVMIVVTFCACLMLTSDGTEQYRVSVFDGGSISVALFVAIVFLFLSNLHVLVVIAVWILSVVTVLVILFLGVATLLLLLPLLPIFAYILYKYRSKLQSMQKLVHISRSST